MAFTLEQAGEEGVLLLSGNLTLEKAEELKSILITSMNQVNKLTLDLGKVTEVDLSCLQLICAANFTSLEFDKKMESLCNGSDVFKKALIDAGFMGNNCSNRAQCRKCLWEEVNLNG
jgi:ABC-type transporter Mla MlaB component